MYELALTLHSTLRLALTLLCAALVARALLGWMGRRPQGAGERLLFLLATIAADLQLVLGLLLYFVWSPVTQEARRGMGAAMKDPTLRFWAVEHGSAMLLAIVGVHAGKILARRASNDRSRQLRTLIAFAIVLALLLVMSPWPFTRVERPILHF